MPTDSTFVEVKNAFQAIAGLESLTAADEFFLTSSVNRAVHRAYNESDSWPRYLVIGEERLLGLYKLSGSSQNSNLVNQGYYFLGIASGSNTTPGTNVYRGITNGSSLIYKNSSNAWIVTTADSYTTQGLPVGTVSVNSLGDAVVQFTEADTVKNDSIENVTTWTPRTGIDILRVVTQSLIPYSQNSWQGVLGNVGEFLRIYRSKPFVNNSALEYEFYVDSLGCNVLNLRSSTAHSVFVNYKKELTTNYTPDSTNIPSEFVDYIIYTALSDFYTGDGQAEKAALAANQANAMLDIELLRLDKKANNNTINKRFSTYVNRQAR